MEYSGTGTTIGTVSLYYSTTGGAPYPNTITTSLSNAGGYLWTIPDAIGTNVSAEVVGASGVPPAPLAGTSSPFTIRGQITGVSAGCTAGVCYVGTSTNITWTPQGTLSGNVDISYSTNGGVSFPNTISSNSVATGTSGIQQTLAWTVPDSIGTNLEVEVISHSNTAVYGQSSVFSIKGVLTLTAPSGGQILYVGNSTNITWAYSGSVGNVELMYSTNGGSTFPNTVVGAGNLSQQVLLRLIPGPYPMP